MSLPTTFPTKVDTQLYVDDIKQSAWKALYFAGFGGMYGLSSAYIQNQGLALKFYTLSGLTFATSLSYFGVLNALKRYRQTDDLINPAASGAITGFIFSSLLKGVKSGLISAIPYALLGTAYELSSNWVYETSREAWIDRRRTMINSVVEREVKLVPTKFPPKQESTNPENK